MTKQDAILSSLPAYQAPLILGPTLWPLGTSLQTQQDGFLVGYVNCALGASRGTMTGVTGSSHPPTTAVGLASAHYYTGDGHNLARAAMTMPIRNTDGCNVTTLATSGAPNFSLSQFGIGPVGQPFFGAWQSLAGSSQSATATSDGFLVAMVTTDSQGDQGKASLTVGSNLRGGCSVLYYPTFAIDDWITQASFCAPVCKGETYSLDLHRYQGTPNFAASWLPLVNTQLQSPRARSVNTPYQAATDGFLVCVLEVTDHSMTGHHQGYILLQQAPIQQYLGVIPEITGAQVQCEPQVNMFLPYDGAMMPVPSGSWYQAAFTTLVGVVNPSVWWIPLGDA